MQKVYEAIDKLICYAEKNLDLNERNADYVRNDVFRALSLDSYEGGQTYEVTDSSPDGILQEFLSACLEKGLFEEWESEYYLDYVMGALTLSPKEVEDKFYAIQKQSGAQAATEWFYDYSVKSDYVKKSKLDKNVRFNSNGLVITINKAKPEFRDPKKAQSGNSTKGGYPKCTICHENEGFSGRSKRTLRTINITLGGQKWFWQFSPYGYFYQHGIAVNYNHTPMHVDAQTFVRLMDFVDAFPHWFIGSNAPLPRIGGSVLAHDHYQGGGEILPMHTAAAKYVLTNAKYPNAIVEIPNWQGTVIRVVSHDKQSIVDVSEQIRQKWVNYKNEELGIIPVDGDGVHSAVSPTVVKTDRGYEMSLILRNNITSEEYPDGVFHAHPEYHVIKKESIGLIEAQGLFILPGRLEKQLKDVETAIVNGSELPEELKEFTRIYAEVKAICNGDYSAESAHRAVEEELGKICGAILENTAVFKDEKLTLKFMEELGFVL